MSRVLVFLVTRGKAYLSAKREAFFTWRREALLQTCSKGGIHLNDTSVILTLVVMKDNNYSRITLKRDGG